MFKTQLAWEVLVLCLLYMYYCIGVCSQCVDCTGLVTPATQMPTAQMNTTQKPSTDVMTTTAAPAASSNTAESVGAGVYVTIFFLKLLRNDCVLTYCCSAQH